MRSCRKASSRSITMVLDWRIFSLAKTLNFNPSHPVSDMIGPTW